MTTDAELAVAVAALGDRHSDSKRVNEAMDTRYPARKASEVDPTGVFERAYAEVAGRQS